MSQKRDQQIIKSYKSKFQALANFQLTVFSANYSYKTEKWREKIVRCDNLQVVNVTLACGHVSSHLRAFEGCLSTSHSRQLT